MSIGDAEAFREAIIGASLELGQAYGEDGVTMRAIASKLGTSATTLYTCFESKAAIMRELRVRGLHAMANSIAEALENADARDSLVEVTRRYIGFARDNPWLYHLLMLEESIVSDIVTDAQREELGTLYQRISAGLRQRIGALAQDPVADEQRMFARWWASAHGAAALIISRRLRADHPIVPVGDIDGFVDDYARAVVDFMLK